MDAGSRSWSFWNLRILAYHFEGWALFKSLMDVYPS